MCKTCALRGHDAGQTMCTSSNFYTVFSQQISVLGTTPRVIQAFTRLLCAVMNIKISLNSSVTLNLSTVSTPPITMPTRLKFNEFIII